LKSFQRKDRRDTPPDDPGNPTVDSHAEKRSNDTENRNGLSVTTEVFQANGTAERCRIDDDGTDPGRAAGDCGSEKGYDTRDFVAECRHMNVTPHLAQNTKRSGGGAIDGRTTRYSGYDVRQKKRKRIEECFGWLKTIALMRKVRHRGLEKVSWAFTFAAAAYNRVRTKNLLANFSWCRMSQRRSVPARGRLFFRGPLVLLR
jgi:hypothetical protein